MWRRNNTNSSHRDVHNHDQHAVAFGEAFKEDVESRVATLAVLFMWQRLLWCVTIVAVDTSRLKLCRVHRKFATNCQHLCVVGPGFVLGASDKRGVRTGDPEGAQKGIRTCATTPRAESSVKFFGHPRHVLRSLLLLLSAGRCWRGSLRHHAAAQKKVIHCHWAPLSCVQDAARSSW